MQQEETRPGAVIRNPVLPGFHPDPSIVRVGGEFVLANSTFEWCPGVRLNRSEDLARWEPLGGALDFESTGLDGWQGDVAAFYAGPPTDQGELAAVRGFHGAGALSSGSRQDARRGTITSPPFVLQGRLLSVLIGGGSRRQKVGVELLVDDVEGDADQPGRRVGGEPDQ